MSSFTYDVPGQKGEIPCLGLGTATLFGEECKKAIRAAVKIGYRAFDTALLYNNQREFGEAINEAIAAGDVTREELFITTKVAFYPAAADGKNTFCPIVFTPLNKKGRECEGIDECLRLLNLSYVDLLLIHNPCTALDEYEASGGPHAFELANSILNAEERKLILARRLASVKYDAAAGEADRAAAWAALEEALANGKARRIGVSNYPTLLVERMAAYAKVWPAVNQLELHPRFSSPSLRAFAAKHHIVLTAYGSGNSITFGKSPVVAAIAAKNCVSPNALILTWTLQHGVSVIPRSVSPAHLEENWLTATKMLPLPAEDMAALDALNEAHPYYWSPMPLLPPGSPADL